MHVSLLPLHEAQDVILAGAVSLLTSVTVSPVIGAITTFAAATVYGVDNDGETPAFLQVLRRLFGDGGLTVVGPIGTAVHGQIMAVAYASSPSPRCYSSLTFWSGTPAHCCSLTC